MTLTEARTHVLLLRTDIHKAKRRHAPTRGLWKRLRWAVAELAAMEARHG